MGIFDSVYNSNYGVREERNSSGNTYYDRNGDSHYDRSDAIRANERILSSRSSNSTDESDDSDYSVQKKDEIKRPVKRKTPKYVKPELSEEDKTLLNKSKETHDQLCMFVDESDFSSDNFIDAAKFMNIVVPFTVLMELKKYKPMDFKRISTWESILSEESVRFINEVHSVGVATSDEAFYVIERLDS